MDYPSLSFDDPRVQGMLGMASGLLQAGGASPYPVGLGQAFGQGIQGMQGAQQAAMKMRQQQTLVDLEKQKTELTAEQVKQAREKQELINRIMARLAPGTQTAGGVGPMASAGATGPMASAGPWSQGYTPPQAPQAPQQARGGFPFSLADVTALHAAGAPDLLQHYREAQPNISNQNGILMDPRYGPVGSVPQTNQQGYSTQTIQNPDGSWRVAPVQGAAEAYRNQQDIGARTTAQYDLQTVPPTGPNSPPMFTSRLALLGGDGQGPRSAGMSPKATAEQAAAAAQQTDVAKNYAGIFNNLQNSAMTAPGQIAKLERIGSLLNDFEGGKFSKSAMGFAQAANSLGFKIDPKLPAKEAAEALAGEVALSLRDPSSGAGMPGAMSDADREFLKGMTPNLGQTAEGRKTIIETKVKLLERQSQVASMIRQYKEKHGVVDEKFFSQLQNWSNQYPVFGK